MSETETDDLVIVIVEDPAPAPVRASKYAPRPLRQGQRVRLSPDGPIQTVLRVNKCAAYIGRKAEKVVMLWDAKAGESKPVKLATSVVESISANAFVYAAEEE